MNWRFFLYPLIVAAVVGYTSWPQLKAAIAATNPLASTYNQTTLVENLAMQMAQPVFGGTELTTAIVGTDQVRLERYLVDIGKLYFSVPSDLDINILYNMTTDSKQMLFGKNSAGDTTVSRAADPLVLDKYQYSGVGRRFFSLPVSALNVDKDTRLSFSAHGVKFDPTVEELVTMSGREHWHAGSMYFLYNNFKVVNHAGMVVTEDAALDRLAQRLVNGAPSQEAAIQRLLDFATAITYDTEDGYITTETMRNPHKTIVMNLGDCGNKVVLFASLLEQIDVDYKLVYTGALGNLDHILVAVPGNFSRSNSLHFTDKDGTEYFLAETTARGFQIGYDRLSSSPLSTQRTMLVQSAGRNPQILDHTTGAKLAYR